jgi:hypothetical protein
VFTGVVNLAEKGSNFNNLSKGEAKARALFEKSPLGDMLDRKSVKSSNSSDKVTNGQDPAADSPIESIKNIADTASIKSNNCLTFDKHSGATESPGTTYTSEYTPEKARVVVEAAGAPIGADEIGPNASQANLETDLFDGANEPLEQTNDAPENGAKIYSVGTANPDLDRKRIGLNAASDSISTGHVDPKKDKENIRRQQAIDDMAISAINNILPIDQQIEQISFEIDRMEEEEVARFEEANENLEEALDEVVDAQ